MFPLPSAIAGLVAGTAPGGDVTGLGSALPSNATSGHVATGAQSISGATINNGNSDAGKYLPFAFIAGGVLIAAFAFRRRK